MQKMKIDTDIEGPVLIKHQIFNDSRGFFLESYNQQSLEKFGITENFVQDNISYSTKNVLRGLHYQIEPLAQAKIVRVLSGEVLDVVVDIRPDSPTLGQHISLKIKAEDRMSFYIPGGFAHGFLVLSDHAHFFYKCSNYWSRDHERGILYNDPDLNIDWGIEETELTISDKDLSLPFFQNR